MDYYRKAAALLIAVFALILPLFLEVETEIAVVNLEEVITNSTYLSHLKTEGSKQLKTESDSDQDSLKNVEDEMLEILKSESEELALENNYSSVLIDQAVYQGGKNISQELADRIDSEYK
ncbi:MAG: hypothetical protein ACOCWP_03970 [Halanaerobium sp.]